MLICLLVISILLVASYVGAATWSEKELPDSISAMVYLLPEKGRWLWIVWIWAATFTLTPILFEVMPDNWQALAHGFATSMLFVGAMPLVRHEANKGHYALAISAGIFSQLCVLIINHVWMLTWSVLAVISIFTKSSGEFPKWLTSKGVTIIEIVCYVNLVGAIITHLLKN